MLQRVMTGATGDWVAALLLAVPFACSHCGAPADERTGTARQAILEGGLSDVQDAPVLLLFGPEGQCSACLVAPNLAATARHCVAMTKEGPFSCAPSGELVLTVEGYGSIGADHPPGSLKFYDARRESEPKLSSQAADAYGAKILSTLTASACRDDLAFVVLDRPVSPTPLPVRLTSSAAGEAVSLLGFGVTENIADPTALRVRTDAELLGVGPDVATNLTQPAPVRAVRTSPVSCVGDSGGAIVSNSTGELIAVISLGTVTGGPFCSNSGFDQSVGPRLGAYPELVNAAFAAARAALPSGDAGSTTSDGASEDVPNVFADAAEDAATPANDGADPASAEGSPDVIDSRPDPDGYQMGGGGCAMGHRQQGLRCTDPWWAAFVGVLIAARRRARRPRSPRITWRQ